MGHEIATLMRKEFLETLREFKSLGLFILFCTLFFPMFSLFGNTEISSALIEDSLTNQKGKIGVRGDVDVVRQVLKDKRELTIESITDIDPVKSIEEDEYDVVVVIPETDAGVQRGAAATKDKTIDVFYNSRSEGTIAWAIDVAAAMNSSQLQVLKSKLRTIGIDNSSSIPNVSYKNIVNAERMSAAPLSETLPNVILFFITTVAIGGAIGGITMERENKRMAMLLMLPIKRESIIYALVLVVATISMLPILSGLLSLSWAFSLDEIADRLRQHHLVVKIPMETVLWMMLLTVPVAISVTASSVLFSCYYRIAQQARGYSLIFIVFLNGLVRYILTIKALHGIMPFIPIADSVYVMQTALDGKANAFEIVVSTVITLAFSALMIHAGANKLNDEKLMMGVEKAPKIRFLWQRKSA